MSRARRGGSHRQSLVAYTDASIDRETGHATGAIIFVDAGSLKLHSGHVMNYGIKGLRIHKPEVDSKIAALHLAPQNSLVCVFSDSSGSVDTLNNYMQRRSNSNLHKFFDDMDEMDFLHQGLARQSRVQFEFMNREQDMMRLADKFSRFARMHEALLKSHTVSSRNDFERQEEILLDVLGTPS